jgi:uncharacterized membrane protein YebE (DUF533 family)
LDLGRIFGAVLEGAAQPPRRRTAGRSRRRAASGPFGLTQTETRQIGRALGALAGVAAEALSKSAKSAPAPAPQVPRPTGASAPARPVPPAAPARRLPEVAAPKAPPTPDPSAEQAEARLILRAMIAAAKSDGALDREEREAIARQLDAAGLTGPERDQVLAEFDNPASVEDLAKSARDPMLAAQLYAAAFVAVGDIAPAERNWLDRFALALKLDGSAREKIEARLGD